MKTLWMTFCISFVGITACNNPSSTVDEQPKSESLAPKVIEWITVDSTETFERLILPHNFNYTILFSEGDPVLTHDSLFSPAKGKHDCVVYIPIDSSRHGMLFVSHESKKADSLLGDGGGGTIFEVELSGDKWDVIGEFHNVDFSGVGGTYNNCGGKQTPLGTIFSAEEDVPFSNTEIASFITDTSNYKKLPRYMNYGYMVEIDPLSKKAMHKLYQMGRFVHEDALCMPDSQTVYLTQDDNPAIFWKFVASKKGDYTKGQLYAYTEKTNTQGIHWVPMPMDKTSLLNITDTAIQRGATLYQRHEWMTQVGDKIYITETGKDVFDWTPYKEKYNANIGPQFNIALGDTLYKDPYGRVLVYDMKTEEMKTVLNGGLLSYDSTACFSNPDALTSFEQNGNDYLLISEDIIGNDLGRSVIPGTDINEVYLLNLALENPQLKDLKRFAIGPKGSETSGGFFTPDGKTLFLSIQHPSPNNPPPFNKSCVVAIRGF